MIRILFVLVQNILSLTLWVLATPFYLIGKVKGPSHVWVELNLEPDFPISAPKSRWLPKPYTFLNLRSDLLEIKEAKRCQGVIVRWDHPLAMGPAKLAEIRRLLVEIREAGIEVVFFCDQLDTRDYPLATAATHIVLNRAGRLYTFKPHMELYFFKGLFEKFGLAAQFVHIGEFKTAGHRFIHQNAPRAQALMMSELLQRLNAELETTCGPRFSPALHELAPMDARNALKHGLVDAEIGEPLLPSFLADSENFDPKSELDPKKLPLVMDMEGWRASKFEMPWKPLLRKPLIAVLDLSGMIVSSGMSGAGAQISPDKVIPALKALKRNRRVRAVILHINSPGGSASASEQLWQEIQDLRQEVPVVAWCTDVAASGGYYLACAADQVVAAPESIVGSIGVIMGKFNLTGTSDKLGIGVETIGEPSLLSAVSELEGQLLENIQADIRSFYATFLDRVRLSRRIPRRKLHRYARGRVYLGRDAQKRGLVDGLGGFEEAYRRALELTQLPEKAVALTSYSYKEQDFRALLRENLLYSGQAQVLDKVERHQLIIEMFQNEGMLAWSGISTRSQVP